MTDDTGSHRSRIRLGSGGEFDLVRMMLEMEGPPPAEGVRVGPGDDCAMVTGAGIMISTDLSIEDVHFRRAWLTPEEIGYRATAAALSDLAAVAARPLGILVSLAMATHEAAALVTGLREGIGEACRSAGAALLGGDLSRSPGPLVLDIIVVGETASPVLRDGARPGDEVWVTGRLGGSASAVRAWEAGKDPHPLAREAFAHPNPRIREALWLAENVPLHALIDLSDGVAGDAGHLAAASGVDIVLEEEEIPLHPGATDGVPGHEALALALGGGEDFELCFTAPAGAMDSCMSGFRHRFDVGLTRIGRVQEGSGQVLLSRGGMPGAPLAAGGHDHF